MNKQEASSFLKELLAECKLDSNTFVLVEPNPKDTLAVGYTIRVKTIMDRECRQQIREITKKHDLAVIEEQVEIIVYKPKPKNKGGLILK
jgi:hypothetical protein